MQHYKDGYAPFRNYKTYVKVFGSPSSKTPLVILHGGPGSAHNYMLPLAGLTKTDRQVIFYDQLGGGLSDHPNDNSIWGFDLFIDELMAVRKYLGLNEIVLLGHSWGGMLAAEFMCRHPEGIEKVIFASSMLSMPLYREEVDKLKKDLPSKIYNTLTAHEKASTTDTREYAAAMKSYNKRHIFRGSHYPPELQDPKNSFGKTIYETLWGVSEAYPNGSLKNWSRLDDLTKIDTSALVISGQYDELTPRQAVETYMKLPHAQLNIITAASHLAHVEFTNEYLEIISRFLDT